MNKSRALVELAMHRSGVFLPKASARSLWRRVYRQFRDEARCLHLVSLQLGAFRGFVDDPARVKRVQVANIMDPSELKD